MDVTVFADQGTHLLIGQNHKFAIVERRNNRLYNCHAGKRDGIPVDAIAEIDRILDERDWTDEATARATFSAIVDRGTQINQTMR